MLNLLRGQLEKLASSDSTCLILPGEWTKYQGLFTSNRLSKTSVVISPATLHNLKQRNKRLDISGTRDDFPSPTHGQSLLKYLDATNNWDDIHAYSQKCMELAGSAGSTVSLVLRWATTVNRPGRHRLYAAVRLIQHLHASDVKTDEYIIDFLSTVAKTEGYVLSTVTRILSELVYSGSFSFNKYLQWLIATGFMSHGAQVSELGRKSHHTILHGVSSRNLPEHVQNLKNIILMSSGFLDDEGIQNVNGCENIKKLIVAALEKAQVSDKSGLPPAVKSLPDSEMVELSLWLQVQTKAFTNLSCHCSAEECDHVEKLPLKLKTFHTFRGLFEDLNDYRGLALFVASIKTNDVPLLSAIADTLLYHHKVLSAIGTLTSTSQALIQQYQTTTDIQALQAPICTLLMSLIEIATSLLYDTTLAAKLRRDVQRCRANLAGVAWSPASDNPVDAQSNPVDEIDQLLASGNTMDEKTLTRVFSTVTSRLDQVSRGEEVQPSSVTRWFFVLKTLNEAAFEKNMAAWIAAELQICQPDRLLEYTRPLIGIGCVTFETFIGICCDPTSDYGLHDTIAANNLFPLLSLLFTPQPSNQSWQSQVCGAAILLTQ